MLRVCNNGSQLAKLHHNSNRSHIVKRLFWVTDVAECLVYQMYSPSLKGSIFIHAQLLETNKLHMLISVLLEQWGLLLTTISTGIKCIQCNRSCTLLHFVLINREAYVYQIKQACNLKRKKNRRTKNLAEPLGLCSTQRHSRIKAGEGVLENQWGICLVGDWS